jgi:hypothetical protein
MWAEFTRLGNAMRGYENGRKKDVITYFWVSIISTLRIVRKRTPPLL